MKPAEPEVWAELAATYRSLGYELFILPWGQFSHHSVRTALEETFTHLGLCGRQESEEMGVYCMKDSGHEEPCAWTGLDLSAELGTLHSELNLRMEGP